jgi:hypothetical protein
VDSSAGEAPQIIPRYQGMQARVRKDAFLRVNLTGQIMNRKGAANLQMWYQPDPEMQMTSSEDRVLSFSPYNDSISVISYEASLADNMKVDGTPQM